MNPRTLDILLALEFDEPEPLPLIDPSAPMIPIEATPEGKIYHLVLDPGDPILATLKPGACEDCRVQEAIHHVEGVWRCDTCQRVYELGLDWRDFEGFGE